MDLKKVFLLLFADQAEEEERKRIEKEEKEREERLRIEAEQKEEAERLKIEAEQNRVREEQRRRQQVSIMSNFFSSLLTTRPNKLECLCLVNTFQSSLTFAGTTRSLPKKEASERHSN